MFCVGFSYTQLSSDLDATLGNLINILLISSLEDMVAAILLPVPVANLMAHVKLGNKQFHYEFEEDAAEEGEEAGDEKAGDEAAGDEAAGDEGWCQV